MFPFRFRIKFALPAGSRVSDTSATLEFTVPGHSGSYSLNSMGKEQAIAESGELVLTSPDFQSEAEACERGLRAQTALLVTALRLRIAVDLDLGAEHPKGGLAHYGRAYAESIVERPVLNDKVGMQVYPAEPRPLFMGIRASGTVGKPSNVFLEIFRDAYTSSLTVAGRVQLATELYMQSQFQSSSRARFITLVVAIESMLEPASWEDAKTVAHVKNIIKLTVDAALNEADRQSLLGSLDWHRKESISRTGKRLIQRYLGDRRYGDRKAAAFFSECYRIRSAIAHTGTVPESSRKPSQIVHELDKMVSELLLAVIGFAQK